MHVQGYEDLQLIGRGGTAQVFSAVNSEGKRVALKVIAGVWDDNSLKKFDRECEAMRKLSDVDGVVPILGSGTTAEGSPYIEMPLYEGSLQDNLDQQGSFSEQEAVSIIENVGLILNEAHNHQVFHRDMKPGNILLDSAGKLWISDFGLASLTTEGSMSTTAMFTPGFSPPEAFVKGRRGVDGVLIDIYGMAATLWTLISGRSPFTEEGVQSSQDPLIMMRRVSEEIIPAPSADTSHNLSNVIMTAMAKNPEDRYESIPFFLEQLRSDNPVVVHPATISRTTNQDELEQAEMANGSKQESQSFLNSGRNVALLGAIALLVISLGAFLAIWLGNQGDNKETASDNAPAAPDISIDISSESVATNTSQESEEVPNDSEILAQVRQMLPDGVDATVTNGIVNLFGELDTQDAINSLLARISAIEGVKNVNNSIVVSTTTTPTTQEQQVTQPPVTQPPVTKPPVTQPPVTQPPVTQGPPAAPNLATFYVSSISGSNVKLTFRVECSDSRVNPIAINIKAFPYTGDGRDGPTPFEDIYSRSVTCPFTTTFTDRAGDNDGIPISSRNYTFRGVDAKGNVISGSARVSDLNN